MRVGANLFVQNYPDWDRFEAEERGENVASRPETADRAIFLEEVELARQMDALGFDSLWTIEHHFTPYTMVTNPLQLLTYLAGVTRYVDLGSDVVVLPWHNPVRVAEDVNMLDALLGPDRKIMCGVGRGLGRREYQGLSVDQNEARGRFDEGLKILHQLLKYGHCTYDGEFWQPKDVRLRPQPDRDLSGQLFCAGGTSETTEIIARYDVKPLAIPTSSLDQALGGVRNYANLRRAAGYDPVHTKLALWTHVCDNAADAERARKYVHRYSDSALRHYEMTGTHLKDIKGYETYAANAQALRANPDAFRTGFLAGHPIGTPDAVIAQTTALAEAFGADEVMFVFKYGGLPLAEAEKSLKLFADEVLPALQAVDTVPLQPA